MIYLNIAPQELKNEMRINGVYKSLKRIILMLTIALILFAVSFPVFELILQEKLIETVEETTLVVKNTENYSARARDINGQMVAIEKIQKDTVLWSYLIESLAKKLNGGISFTRVMLDKNARSVTLFGHAESRDDLLSLKLLLEETGIFGDINFPIKNILEKENINFEISAKFNNYEFEKLQ